MGTMLVNLMHISVCRYDGAGAQCQSFGESAGSKILSEAETSFLKNIFELKQRKYPGIYALEPDILAGEIRDPAQEDSWILFGPILLAPANAARFQHAGRKFGKLEDIGLHLQICELNTLVAGMILYYGYLTGKELSLAEFLEYNKEEFPSVQKIHEQLGRDLFAHQEQAGINNTYDQESREQVEMLMEQMTEKQGVTEELKVQNRTKWVRLMNNIKASAEEMVLREILYI